MPLLDEDRNAIRVYHYSYQAERTDLPWVERIVRFVETPLAMVRSGGHSALRPDKATPAARGDCGPRRAGAWR